MRVAFGAERMALVIVANLIMGNALLVAIILIGKVILRNTNIVIVRFARIIIRMGCAGMIVRSMS